MHIEKYLLRKT